ncbi:hypothetical protein XP315_23455 [Xanthomonas perforans]|uniref:Uncharacterized protein n=1 Tax=Xanthomonas perforans TaxID=442694 RepID=A0ABR5EKP6_XANPE|nr:hypothetical protein XP315_23455 [Xanthomonas perforans]
MAIRHAQQSPLLAVAGQKLLKACLSLDKDPVASHRFQAFRQGPMLNRLADASLFKVCIDPMSDHGTDPFDFLLAIDAPIEKPEACMRLVVASRWA